MPKNSGEKLTLEEAYQAAFLWFDHKGEPPEDISEPAHGSIQVTTETTLARVRMGESPADQASVLALLRADPGDKRLAIFSTSGFTPGAISVAESQGIALFAFDAFGTAHPKTTHARSLAPETQPDPPFAPVVEDNVPAWSDSQLPGQGGPVASSSPAVELDDEFEVDDDTDNEDEWSECPNCGTTHFKNAHFCRSCGTDLETGRPHGHTLAIDGTPLVCATCGGMNIKLAPDISTL